MSRKLLSATTSFLVAMSLSSAAFASEVVELSYTKSELATPAKTAKLLERINRQSKEACDTGSSFSTKRTKASCADRLVRQFIAAIDDEGLTRLAADAQTQPYRTAAR